MNEFKICTCCGEPWYSREAFLTDENVQLVGYQVNFEALELGYFLFNHLKCESTIAIHAGLFRDLYSGPVFSRRFTKSEKCPGYCNHKDELGMCPTECECAYVRGILHSIRHWPKQEKEYTPIPMAQFA